VAPRLATTGTQDRYCALCPAAPKRTTNGPQKREYSHELVSAEIGQGGSPVFYGHRVYTGVDSNVHGTFGRTKTRQPLPRLTGRSELRKKCPRNFTQVITTTQGHE
jgi:hypothetical protein